MPYDLIVRNGSVIDGSGLPRFRADVAVTGGRIARIGRISERAEEEIDAEGQVVAPGFIDLHTHMDAQVFWDPLGTSSCYHGVTSVVMGNCGFTLAPSRDGARGLVVRNLERAEDIAADAMRAGIDWCFETFREYIGALERLPKGINYAPCVGHSALRTFVMGERAFEEVASEDDLKAMRSELRDGLRAGAAGFTTSRTRNHQTADDRPVASRLATWDEVAALVDVMREENTGVFELANEDALGEQVPPYIDRLLELAVRCGRPVTWGIGSSRRLPGAFRSWTEGLERIARAGGRAFGMVHARAFNVVLGFRTHLPFDALPVWRELRALPLEEQAATLRDPVARKRLVEIAKLGPYVESVGAEARKPDYDWIFPLVDPLTQGPSVQQIATQRAADPDETFLDLALESDLGAMFLQPFANEDPADVLELMRHPRTVVTFSDSGAHVSQIMDSSIPTHVLAHWTRQREELTLEEAVRMLTFEPASAWGFADRGLLREGLAADLVVFDPMQVGPRMPEVVADLPGGCRRLLQKADGIAASIVGGRAILRDGEPTGAHPGRVLRSTTSRSG